jgi:hypothetical protein
VSSRADGYSQTELRRTAKRPIVVLITVARSEARDAQFDAI